MLNKGSERRETSYQSCGIGCSVSAIKSMELLVDYNEMMD